MWPEALAVVALLASIACTRLGIPADALSARRVDALATALPAPT